jgi:IPT/TIG domain
MQLFDPNNPNEKKKMIAAAVLGVAAVAVLGYVFFGGSSTKPTSTTNTLAKASPTPGRIAPATETAVDDAVFQPVVYNPTLPAVSEADRNIFAYYEPTPKPIPAPSVYMPTPTPVPPLTISSAMPSNVYARTADFSLQIMGDKFTPAVHVTIDGRDLPTRFINAQQVFTTVPAAIIANPGPRQVMVRNNDGQLYSNTITLTVMPPPLPNYNYIGIIGKPRFNDTAVLQDKGSKDLVNAQRGDVIGGRFRVSSISEKEVVLIDTTLKIRHTITFTADAASGPQFRPPVRVSDEEPE